MLFWLILIAGTLCYIGLVLIIAACHEPKRKGGLTMDYEPMQNADYVRPIRGQHANPQARDEYHQEHGHWWTMGCRAWGCKPVDIWGGT